MRKAARKGFGFNFSLKVRPWILITLGVVAAAAGGFYAGAYLQSLNDMFIVMMAQLECTQTHDAPPPVRL